ncbi:MAG: YbhB/YbcL family Raf kinase inhibitor-like protein [Candidatus Lloydbacteria bacterium CG22_combo_CG10-13_8_21_14_all_47_15]|uniref:YbhB/YbcL family Raf kinase inhibitor-like protein n=1 Tax=Candidatus Lloydbacteria bacterium CG22_combo_CG10-13_8_21_14_all_47_15 TaxID=1974635 RepID=A0A2H0CWU2_9BACT|nr:MAG: YbhB/YbcL family Raf kinase inhibitor-like protein [Candidatus Lloydbacteria bacterium CG22_combo_CG10-13_8_21_14_all_47_15]
MKISSSSFGEKEIIQPLYTCDGTDTVPPLSFSEVPAGTESFAIIVDDPDATGGRTFTHWIIWNIPADTREIKEGEVPSGAVQGMTDFGKVGYGGPCPPKGNAPHRYFFKLYALNSELSISEGAPMIELLRAMEGHILEQAEFFALYGRL